MHSTSTSIKWRLASRGVSFLMFAQTASAKRRKAKMCSINVVERSKMSTTLKPHVLLRSQSKVLSKTVKVTFPHISHDTGGKKQRSNNIY